MFSVTPVFLSVIFYLRVEFLSVNYRVFVSMAAAEGGSLFESTDCGSWRAALRCYEEVVGLVAAQKNKKGKKSKEDSLAQLDAW